MKFKNLITNLSKEDILNLIGLQDKLTIKQLTIDKNIEVKGLYKVVGINFEFYTKLVTTNFNNNVLYVKVEDFQLANKSNSNIFVKKSINFITNSINDIDGITLDKRMLKIDLKELIYSYCTEELGIRLNSLEINKIELKKDEIELSLALLDISVLKGK